ncbi:hypothetical protein Tco_0597742 [Tanacetum coccineum]
MKDSILERNRENLHFKLSWMLLLSLHAILHFSPLQMFLKFTCTNSGILSTSMKIPTGLFSPEEPTRKSNRVKRPAKKSTNAPTTGVVIRQTPVMSLSKKKEKMTVEKRKGIDLLSEVALTKEAMNKFARRGRDEDDSNNDHDSRSEGSNQESDNGDDNTQSDSEKGSDSVHETDENE